MSHSMKRPCSTCQDTGRVYAYVLLTSKLFAQMKEEKPRTLGAEEEYRAVPCPTCQEVCSNCLSWERGLTPGGYTTSNFGLCEQKERTTSEGGTCGAFEWRNEYRGDADEGR